MNDLTEYFILKSYNSVFVKEGKFFRRQGGNVRPWGRNWTPVKATSIESARQIGLATFPSKLIGNPYWGQKQAEGLLFSTLRTANIARLSTFKNAKGLPAHFEPDGSDWCLAQWCNAVCGELGELANIIKKVDRGDFTLDEALGDIADECADVLTYLDILAFRAGVDLEEAVVSKFNRVSNRVGSPVYIEEGNEVVNKET